MHGTEQLGLQLCSGRDLSCAYFGREVVVTTEELGSDGLGPRLPLPGRGARRGGERHQAHHHLLHIKKKKYVALGLNLKEVQKER